MRIATGEVLANGYDGGGKLVETPSGWATGTGRDEALDVALSALRTGNSAPLETSLVLMTISCESPDSVTLTDGLVTNSYRGAVACTAPPGSSPLEDVDLLLRRARAEYASEYSLEARIRIAAKYFSEVSGRSPLISREVEFGCIRQTPDGLQRVFLRGDSTEIAATDADRIFERFGAVPTANFNPQDRIDVDNVLTGTHSAVALLGTGVTENITVQPYYDTRIFLKVIDATGLEGNADPFTLKGELPALEKTGGKVKRTIPFDDGTYAAKSSSSSGATALAIDNQGPLATVPAVTISIGTCTATNGGVTGPPYNQLQVTWSSTGMPSGTTFDVSYNNSVSGGSGSTTGLSASPATFSSVTFASTPGRGVVTISAQYNGLTIATVAKSQIYAT